MGTYNPGDDLKIQTFSEPLGALPQPPPPPVLAFLEFHMSESLFLYRLAAARIGYHLLHSSKRTSGGVGVLVHRTLAAHLPQLHEILPGILVYVELDLHQNIKVSPPRICAYYGSGNKNERETCSTHLSNVTHQNAILMGDFNATTQITHSTAKRNNDRPWFKSHERGGRLHTVVTSFHDQMVTRAPEGTMERRAT